MYSTFLIKYGEIGIKGKNRYLFENALMNQIKYALKRCDGEYYVHKAEGRIYVDAKEGFDYQDTVDNLSSVFGITGICPVKQIDRCDIDGLKAAVIEHIKVSHNTESHTFKMHVRRAHKNYPYDSMELNALLGEAVLEAFPALTVDVHNPEYLITVEIREKIYIYSTVIPGPGGMPVGTNGKAMLLLSGGIDSPVAGYMIAKRGVKIDAVYFHAPPYTSEQAKQKVVDLARIVSKYSGPIYLHVINFTDIQMAIYEKCPHDELTIIMRRYMMKIAETIASETECIGLITGESIGQVASQTMASLYCTNEVCTMPVYRPCIGMDKQEIVTLSEKIGTYETSILPFEDCCTIFVAKHPVTKPSLEVIKKHETHLDDCIDELLKTALETKELIIVSQDM